MTHTAEPMTLTQVRNDIREIEACGGGLTGKGALKQWADAIDAEIAKQSEAEPVAWIEVRAVIEDIHHPQGKSAEVFATDACMNLDVGDYDLYTHPQQRNAVKVTDGMVDAACEAFDDVYEATIDIGDTYYRDNKRVAIRAALSAITLRDREDAK